MNEWLFTAGIAGSLAGVVFMVVGAKLITRRVPPDHRMASMEFAVWWITFGIGILSASFDRLLAAFGSLTEAVAITTLYADILLICVGLWALVCFLVYVFTGKHAEFPLSIFYGGYYLALLYGITAARPSGFTSSQGTITVTYSSGFDLPVVGALVVLLFLPEIVGALLYLSLVFKTRDVTLRYRILLVSGGLLFYLFSSSFIPDAGSLAGLTHTVVTSLLEAVAATIVLIAYFPPAWMRSRLGLRRLDDEVSHTGLGTGSTG